MCFNNNKSKTCLFDQLKVVCTSNEPTGGPYPFPSTSWLVPKILLVRSFTNLVEDFTVPSECWCDHGRTIFTALWSHLADLGPSTFTRTILICGCPNTIIVCQLETTLSLSLSRSLSLSLSISMIFVVMRSGRACISPERVSKFVRILLCSTARSFGWSRDCRVVVRERERAREIFLFVLGFRFACLGFGLDICEVHFLF